MSEIRKRADLNWEKGEAERRNWNPEAGSSHYRVYKWWLSKTDKRPTHENFCHYWRVVLVWAPLRWLAKPLLVLLSLCLAVVGLWLAVTYTGAVAGVVGFVAGCFYVAYCLAVGQQFLHDLDANELSARAVPWLDNKSLTVRAVAVLSALPVLIVIGLTMAIVGALLIPLVGLHDDYDAYSRFWRWLTGAHIGESKWLRWARPWLVVPSIVVVLAILDTRLQRALINVLLACAFIAVLLCVALLLSFLVDHIKEQRKQQRLDVSRQAKEREIDQLLQIVFEVVHPEWTHNTDRFKDWRARYARFCMEDNNVQEYDRAVWWHVDRLNSAQQEKVWSRLRDLRPSQYDASHAVAENRRPSRLEIALLSIGDYLSLIWSVVLTKKWKICPWVELPD